MTKTILEKEEELREFFLEEFPRYNNFASPLLGKTHEHYRSS